MSVMTNESKKYELRDLNENDISLILAGLSQLSYFKSAEMINRITISFNEQVAKANKKEKKKGE